MTIKIEATRHELEKIKNLASMVDTVLSTNAPSWNGVMYEVQEMLTDAELCEPEPLIKDEKTRKVIKEWAKINKLTNVFVMAVDHEHGYLFWDLSGAGRGQSLSIRFVGELPDTIEDLKVYTIDELCGDEGEE